MGPLAKLPVECLQLILQVLAHNNDTCSLAALLQTSRYIASIALPFLYDDPYRQHIHDIMLVVENTPIRSEYVLSHMLLSQLPPDSYSSVISHTLRLGPSNTRTAFASNSPLDYFAYIRHLRLPAGAVDLGYFWPRGCWHPDTDAFMNGPEFSRMRKAHNLLPAYDDNMGIEEEIQFYHFQVVLWREALWTLASPIFEQLQSMTISVFDLDRYSRIQGRLGSLEHIHFALDDVVDYSEDAYYGGEMVMSDEFRAAAEARKERNFRGMVQFVRDHARLFPGRLKSVTSYDSDLWPDLDQTCPVEVELEILRILPPLQAPTSLNKTNFLHLSAHLQSTDLSHVQEITDLESPSLWFNLLRDGREFLQRCRSLKSIHMDSLGPGSFSWASQEKRDQESLSNSNNSGTTHGSTGASALGESRSAYLKYGLVPLENFHILEAEEEPLSDEADDVVFAFSQTLKKLTITAATYQQMHIPRTLLFGRGWVDLPVLTTLYISAAWNKLALDTQLYRHCPNLIHASLTDNSTRYQCQDIVTCFSAELPRLDTLELIGWSALSFHPDILNSTVALGELWIGIERDDVDSYFIPPHEELDRSFGVDVTLGSGAAPRLARPRWTWDWYLPQLTSLTLTAEFAFRFQFRMLQGCPALDFMSLYMRASLNTAPRTRVLKMSELFMPRTTAGTGQKEEAIVAPALTVLRLTGRWEIDNSMLEQFFIRMFPKLEDLEEDGMHGYLLENLVEVVRTMPNRLEGMHLSLIEPSEELAQELGLVCENGGEDEDEDEAEGEVVKQDDTEDQEEGDGGLEYNYDSVTSAHRLLRALFCRVPDKYLSDLLRLTYQFDPDGSILTIPAMVEASAALGTAATTVPFDYFTYIRHLNLEPWAVEVKNCWPRRGFPFNLSRYLESEKFRDLLSLIDMPSAQFLEQLQSFSIPASNLESYLDVIGHMRSLERIQFVMDELFEHRCLPVSEAAELRRTEVLRLMAGFVSEHAQLYKGKLKAVSIKDSGLWCDATQSFPMDMRLQLWRILPPLHKPRILGDELINWMRFVAHVQETDLGQLEEIAFPSALLDTHDSLCDNRQFLHRCRSLRRMDMLSLGGDSFKWAVQEKGTMDGLGNSGVIDSGNSSGSGRRPMMHALEDP
ncbi:hypothetical protein BGW39_007997 [Mortierella sp. 14UC]|nr:hypothetical protein BGW39_007997 [Mortierella sp. 14UC]